MCQCHHLMTFLAILPYMNICIKKFLCNAYYLKAIPPPPKSISDLFIFARLVLVYLRSRDFHIKILFLVRQE